MRPTHWWYTVPLRLRSLVRRRRVECELDDEFRFHLEQQIDADVARGIDPDEARNAALRAFGGVEQRKEECRDVRHVRIVDEVIQDVHYAVRVLRRSPGFAVAAILIMALGIGANSAMFSLIHAVLLRDLPYPDADRLVRMVERGNNGPIWVAWPDFVDWRATARSFESMGAVRREGFTVNGLKEPIRVEGRRAPAWRGTRPALSESLQQGGRGASVGTGRLGAALTMAEVALLSLFAMLALILAGAGIYGVLSYSVAQRTREFGIRMALGASGTVMIGQVLWQGARLALTGVGVGLLLAPLLTRFISTQLFGVGSLDPITFVAAGATVVGLSLLACWIPARRASAVDPVQAIRAD